jgi:dihydrofolate reductase
VKEAPENLRGKVEMYSGDINELILKLEKNGYTHAYIDGGTTITSFLNNGLISEMIITKAPILLGEGLPLFGKINKTLNLENTEVKSFPNDWYQFKCCVNYL